MRQLGQNLTAGTARALIDTVINGGSLQDGLQAALKGAFLDTLAAQGANAIGDLNASGTLDVFTHKVAHAIAGCAVGVARSGDSGGCAAGAIGATVGELAAEGYGRKADTVQFASMIGSLAVAVSGGDATQIAQGGQAAANAAANNYLSHDENEERRQARKSCYESGDAAACERLTALNNLDAQRDQRVIELANNCKDDCVQVVQFALDELRELGCTGPHICDDQTLKRAWRVALEKADGTPEGAFGPDDVLLFGYGLIGGGIKVLGVSTRTGGAGVRVVVTPVTADGAANAATYSRLTNQLKNEELAKIAAQDPRLASAANNGWGNTLDFRVGSGTAREADRLGKIWVGDGAKMTSDGTGWVGLNGTRVYRMPAAKDSPYATTGIQANFERYAIDPASGKITKIGNGHLNITDLK